MAQDPEPASDSMDTSHDMDLVVLFGSTAIDAEMEASNIHAMLEASGIPSVLVGTPSLPVLEFQVQVPRSSLEEAERLLVEAREAGPEAADEAEAESENPVAEGGL